MIAAAPGVSVGLELRSCLADLYCAYDNALNDGALERWPEFFTTTCIYKVIPRENVEQGFPVALIYCESRDMLADRVVALRETALFAPRMARRFISGVCVRAIEADGLHLTANFAVFQTMQDQPSELFLRECFPCPCEVLWRQRQIHGAGRSCGPLGQSQSCTSRTYQHLRPAVLTTGGAGCSSATREKPYPSTCQ